MIKSKSCFNLSTFSMVKPGLHAVQLVPTWIHDLQPHPGSEYHLAISLGFLSTFHIFHTYYLKSFPYFTNLWLHHFFLHSQYMTLSFTTSKGKWKHSGTLLTFHYQLIHLLGPPPCHYYKRWCSSLHLDFLPTLCTPTPLTFSRTSSNHLPLFLLLFVFPLTFKHT